MSLNRALAPSMVGRRMQLHDCTDRLALAHGGAGQTILIAGEAGIGKTRLVREFVQAVRASGRGEADILEGHCSDDDPAVPFGPFIDALRQMVRTLGAEAVAAMAGSWSGDLARLLPELASLTAAPPTADDPQTQKRRLFEAVAHVLFPRESPGARVLVLEDVHWIDRTSEELLLYLARLIPRERLLVLATYRANEVEIRPTLAHLVVELNRERLAHEIRLTPLSDDELAAMLEAILRRHVPGGFVEMLHDRTGGNPFFAEEILESLLERDALDSVIDAARHGRSVDRLGVPFSVSESIRGRTAGLSPETTVTLQYAATIGRRFDFAVLRELAGGNERELLRRIKAMIAAQLVVEESAEGFAFRHALTRQAVYEGLLGRERTALHREIAEAMERVHAASLDAHTADLAYHCYEAGLWEKALTYAARAAEQAQRLHAPRAAVEQITRALEAARHVTAGEEQRARLLLQRGDAYELLGDYDAAHADREAALACARVASDGQLEWQALNNLGMQWAAHDYQRAGAYYEQALAVARTMDDALLIAHSLNRVGNLHLNMEEPREAIQLHEEALAIFQGASDVQGTADTLDLLGMSALLGADMHRSAAYCAESAALYQHLDDRRGLASSLGVRIVRATNYHIAFAVPASDARDDPHAEGVLARRIAREIHWRAGESFALTVTGMCLGVRGKYARALALLGDSLAIAEEIAHHQWRIVTRIGLGGVALDLLHFEEARAQFERALALARENNSPQWIRVVTGLLARAHLAQGDLAMAASLLDGVLLIAWPAETIAQRHIWYARAEHALARGEAALALDIADELLRSAPNIPATAHEAQGAIPSLGLLRGEALFALGRVDEAEPALRATEEGARTYGMRPILWRAHVALAGLYRTARRPDEAEREFAAARAIVDALAADVPNDALREAFVRGTDARIPRPRPPTLRDAAAAYGGLSAREREVAALVAAGKSNRAIAQTLFLSERTVAAHLGNIFGKLAISSRTQLAGWAIEAGLAPRERAEP